MLPVEQLRGFSGYLERRHETAPGSRFFVVTWQEILCTLEMRRDCITDGRIEDAVELEQMIEVDFEWLGVTAVYQRLHLREHAKEIPPIQGRGARAGMSWQRRRRMDTGWEWPASAVPVACIQPGPGRRLAVRAHLSGLMSRDVQ